MENDKTISIGIVGGGLLGMTLALRLAQHGCRVTLLEAAERMGGLAVPRRIGEYTWDQFYHVILLSDFQLLDLLKELGLMDQIHWKATKTGFFVDRKLYSLSNMIEFLFFPALSFAERLRLGFSIFYASRIRSGKRLEKIPVTEWLINLSGEKNFNKIWLPLLKSKLGENYRIVSASFIWASIARMYSARRSGHKQEMFGYVEGGYATILDSLQKRLDEMGVETLCNIQIKRVFNDHERARLISKEGKSLLFDKIVLTVPTTEISNLCEDLSVPERDRLRKLTYQGLICLALILKRPLSEYYITNIADDRIPFTGVIEMTAIVDRKNFDGNCLIYLPLYLKQDDSFWKKNEHEIQEEFLCGLEMMFPFFKRKDIVASAISRANAVLPIPALNYSNQLLPALQTSLRNIFIVNSAQIANGAMNVNEIVGLGNRKAQEIKTLLS